MKVIFERKELKECIKGHIRESFDEMARDHSKINYYHATVDNIERLYENGANILVDTLYTNTTLSKELEKYGKTNKNSADNFVKAQKIKDKDLKLQKAAEQQADALEEMARISDDFYTDMVDWSDYENNEMKPEYIQSIMKGLVTFPTMMIGDLNPEEVHFNKVAFKNETTENIKLIDGEVYTCWRDGGRYDTSYVPGALRAVLTVYYGENGVSPKKPTLEIAKFISLPLLNVNDGIGVGALISIEKDGFNIKDRQNVQGQNSTKMIIDNFDWEEFRKICNQKLRARPIDVGFNDDGLIKNGHMNVWGLNKGGKA